MGVADFVSENARESAEEMGLLPQQSDYRIYATFNDVECCRVDHSRFLSPIAPRQSCEVSYIDHECCEGLSITLLDGCDYGILAIVNNFNRP